MGTVRVGTVRVGTISMGTIRVGTIRVGTIWHCWVPLGTFVLILQLVARNY